MTDLLYVLATVAGVIAFAAGLLWLIEAIAKLIGGRNTWLLFLGAIPCLIGIAVAVLSWNSLPWWQAMLLPVAAPVATTVFLGVCLVLINPVDGVFGVLGLLRSGWQYLVRKRLTKA